MYEYYKVKTKLQRSFYLFFVLRRVVVLAIGFGIRDSMYTSLQLQALFLLNIAWLIIAERCINNER